MNRGTALFFGIPILGLAGLLAAGQWARKHNDERDAGITWAWAYSPRTMQTYLVRADINEEAGTVSFKLEDGKSYTFTDCRPPEGEDNVDSCHDQTGLPWDLNL